MRSALRAVFAFFLLFFCAFCWSTDFYWIGKDSSDWGSSSNWSLSEGGAAADSSPSTDDTAIFSNEATISTAVECGTIISSSSLNFKKKLSVNGGITIDSGDLTVGMGLVYSGDVNVSGNVSIGTAGIAKNSAKITAGGDITFTLGFNGAAISCSSGKLYIGKTDNYKTVISGNVDAASAEFKADVVCNSGCTSVSTTGTQVYDGAITFGDDVTFTASSVTFSGALNSADSNSKKSVVIKGDVSFGESAGETVPLNSLTVNGESSIDSDKKILTTAFQLYTGEVTTTTAYFTSDNSSVTFEKSIKTGDWGNIGISTGECAYVKEPFDGKTQLSITGNAEIYGSNSFNGLSFYRNSGSSATVKFESGKWQSIGTIYYIDGDESYPITLSSTSDEKWYAVFSLAPTTSLFSYTVIKNSRSVESSGSTDLNSLGLTPDSSTVTDFDVDNPTTEGWFIFPDTYYWLGGASSSWSEISNWSQDGETALSSGSVPDSSSGTSKIIVQKGESSSQSPYILKLESDINVKSLSVDSGASVDFSSVDVEASAITNSGTVVISGNQSVSGDFTNNSLVRIGGNPSFSSSSNGSESTVEYFGGTSSSPQSLSWDGDSSSSGKNYETLLISGFVSSSDDFSVEGESLITGGASFSGSGSFSGAVTLGSSSVTAGDVSMSGENVFSGGIEIVSAGAVSLNAGSDFSVAAGASCDSLKISSSANFLGGVSTSGAQQYSGKISFSDGASLSAGGKITFEKDVSSDGSLTVDCGENEAAFSGAFTGSLVLKSPASFSAANSFVNFTVSSESFSSSGSISELKITFAGGTTQSVSGTLKCTGTESCYVLLSSSNSSKWIYSGSASSDNFSYTYVDNSSSETALNLKSSEKTVYDWGKKEGGTFSTKNWFDPVSLLSSLSFSLSLSPVNSSYVYLVSPEKILYGDNSLQELESSGNLDEALEAIKSALKIMDSSASSELFEISQVEFMGGNENYTALLLTLDEKITLDDIPKTYLIFNETEKHIISDFAVNAVKPLYACAKSSGSESDIGTFSVHDFGEDAENSGKLPSGKDIVLQISYSGKNADDENGGVKLFASLKSSLKNSMKSDKINSLLGSSWRVWLPENFEALSSAANTEILAKILPEAASSDSGNTLWNYTFENEDSDSDSLGLKAGDEVQFVFRIGSSKIDHDGNGSETYLYSLWIPEENILSKNFSVLDLWSFSIRAFTKQRGGVSILKNVINLNDSERSVIEVDMKSAGNLNVFIMTLDGNIVRRLAKGHYESGTHFFKWNGTNLSGKSVARGLYFVRVVGPEIDETRKIMCVKK